MRQDIEIKFFLGLNTSLFPEVIITETLKLDFLQKHSASPQTEKEKDEILRNDKTL